MSLSQVHWWQWLIFFAGFLPLILDLHDLLRKPEIPKLPIATGATGLGILSVIVAAKDEEGSIEECVQSLLAQTFKNFEIIAVNDRSRDKTGEILERLAAADPRLRVVQVDELPSGWLGKNHALHLGASMANPQATFLLFIDGDVRLEAGMFASSTRYMVDHQIEHLAALPTFRGRTWLQSAQNMSATYFMTSVIDSGKIVDPNIKEAFVGVGAYNLIRRQHYESFGGHSRLRMEVIDDGMLGKLSKDAGGTTHIVNAAHLAHLFLYESIPAYIKGLEKNLFAAARYSVAAGSAMLVFSFLMSIFPFLSPLVLPAIVCAPWLIHGLIEIYSFGLVCRKFGGRTSYAIAYPLVMFVASVAILNSMATTLWNRGVTWRGTFYSLQELRKNMVPSKPLGF